VADDVEICHFPPGTGKEGGLAFLSPDGRFLVLGYPSAWKLWDLVGAEPRLVRGGETRVVVAFRPDSRQLALGHPDGSITLYDLPSGQPLRRLDPGPVPNGLAWHPNGGRLAVSGQGLVHVRDLETGKVCAEFRQPTGFGPVAWHPDGKTLAALGADAIIRLWDVATGKPTVRLEGFKGGGIVFAFNRAGDLLASNGWEDTLRLWDPRTGQQLFQVRAAFSEVGPRFGPDDRLLFGEVKDGKFRLWEFAASPAYRTLVRDPVLGKCGYGAPAVSPHGRLLVANTTGGLGLWDCRTGAPVHYLPVGAAGPLVFEASGTLLAEGTGGPVRWPVRPDPAAAGLLRIGPPERLPLPQTIGRELACSPDGRVVAGCQPWGALVWYRDRPGEPIPLKDHYDVRSISISPDGRWVATGSWWGTGAKVWYAATGRPVKTDLVPTQTQVTVRFSPDGKWLATAGVGGCRLWAVDSWREGPALGASNGRVAFSREGRLLAVETGQNAVRLLDPDTGREYARLEDPNQDRASWIAFSPDGTQLVVSGELQSLHLWDLRVLREELARRNLDWDLPPYPPPSEPADGPPLRVTVDLGDLALRQRTRQESARLQIEQYRQALARNADSAAVCNNLAWAYLTAPDPLRDIKAALPLAEKAARIEPKNAVYANTLGLAYYRAGRYRDAVTALQANLRNQEDRYLADDLYLLAMSYHGLGERERARDHFSWAVRWSGAQKDLTPEVLEEMSAFHAEAQSVLGVENSPAPAENATPRKSN
jgi:WD40 repeat protein